MILSTFDSVLWGGGGEGGKVFTGVCLFTGGMGISGPMSFPGGMFRGITTHRPPDMGSGIPRVTVSKQALRILLE